MWNSFRTDASESIVAGVTTYAAGGSDLIHAYVARPEGDGPFPGIVLVHHNPGWDELYREFARRFASHGYTVVCPDLNCRRGHGSPTEVARTVNADGGMDYETMVTDCEGALRWLKSLPTSNGKVGVVGTWSGGRYAVLVAGRVRGFDAVANMGGNLILAPEQVTARQPFSPIQCLPDLDAPLIGLFGNADVNPTPDQVNQFEAELKQHGKTYEFHRYDDAGHGFLYHDNPAYRPRQAMDAWAMAFTFLGKHLA